MTSGSIRDEEQAELLLLSGGGGGARLAAGLHVATAGERFSVVTNTGDDFEHFGLAICPDTDSVLYALSQQIDPVRGWGREAESWGVFAELSKLGGPDWFQLGDKDLALHLIRAALLADGLGLCEVTAVLARRLGVTSAASIMPATEDRVRTRVITSEGEMAFQEYFVKHRCEPHLIAVRYEGIEAAKPALPLVSLLENAVGRGVDVVLGPSNPFLSLAPILDVPGMPNLLKERARRVIAVSPIVEGQSLKGPAAKIMSELGLSVSAAGWMQWMSDRYPGLIDVWVWDERDHELADTMRVTHPNIVVTDTVMSDPERARQFAERILRVSRDGD